MGDDHHGYVKFCVYDHIRDQFVKGKHSFKVYEVIVGAKEPSSDSSSTSCRHSIFITNILIAAFQPGTPVVNK